MRSDCPGPIALSVGLAFLLAGRADARQAPVVVHGVTYQAISIDRSSGKTAYDTLDGVEVGVDHRRVQSRYSGPEGRFEIEVVPGTPFNVLFVGQKKVPQLEQLTGQAGLVNEVHVTLLTAEQYLELYGREALTTKLQYIDRTIRGWDTSAAGQAREVIQAIANEFDLNIGR